MTDMMYGSTNAATGGDLADDNNSEYYGATSHVSSRPKLPGLYIGNLTWWTTDQDVINAINSVGVNDVQEVKFFENRNNGQSKGFCVVTFTSEASLPIVMEKLPKIELYGQKPVVSSNTRQSLNLFESQTKTRPPMNPNSNGPINSHAAGIMGISSISGVHAGTQGLPYSSGMNAYGNQAPGMSGMGMGGPRQPSAYHGNMRMQMRTPRPVMRGTMSNSMSNGSMIPGGPHQMNRMRFMQPQAWNNSQGGGGGGNGVTGGGTYNSVGSRMPQMNMDMSNRLGMMGGVGNKMADDPGHGQDILAGQSSQNYYSSHHHSSSQSDHYGRSDLRDHRDLRDERDSSSSRRLVDDHRSTRTDDRGMRHDERSSRGIDRQDDRGSLKQDDRGSSRREERSSRREDGSSRRDDRSSRKESSSSSSRREKSHREDRDRARSRSPRDRSRDRSRERRRERRERY